MVAPVHVEAGAVEIGNRSYHNNAMERYDVGEACVVKDMAIDV